MNNKKTLIILIVCTILIFILTKACSDMLMDKMRTDIENETINNRVDMESSTNKYVKKYKNDWEMLVNFFLMGKIGYDEINLSDKFIKKYPTIDSIVKGKGNGGIENDFFDNYNENMENILTFTCLTGNEKEEMAYQLHYIINENNELDDIEILDSKLWCDKKGDVIRYVKHYYYYDDTSGNTWILCYPYVRVDKNKNYDRVYVTNNFIKKFPNYLTTGVTGDTDYIMFGEHYQDENDKKVCYAEFLGLEWIKTYKLTYDIDEKGYINDIDVELYEKHKTEDPEYIKSYYQEYLDNVSLE